MNITKDTINRLHIGYTIGLIMRRGVVEILQGLADQDRLNVDIKTTAMQIMKLAYTQDDQPSGADVAYNSPQIIALNDRVKTLEARIHLLEIQLTDTLLKDPR